MLLLTVLIHNKGLRIVPPTLCDPMDYSPPGSSVRGIPQANILDWVAIPFTRGSSRPRDQTGSPALQADSLPSEPPGKPILVHRVIKRVNTSKALRTVSGTGLAPCKCLLN